jgi:hypothetical protein
LEGSFVNCVKSYIIQLFIKKYNFSLCGGFNYWTKSYRFELAVCYRETIVNSWAWCLSQLTHLRSVMGLDRPPMPLMIRYLTILPSFLPPPPTPLHSLVLSVPPRLGCAICSAFSFSIAHPLIRRGCCSCGICSSIVYNELMWFTCVYFVPKGRCVANIQ